MAIEASAIAASLTRMEIVGSTEPGALADPDGHRLLVSPVMSR